MWVSPAARGLGVGRRILEKLEALAREFGLNVLRLETNRTLKEAQALYRKCVYLEVELYNSVLRWSGFADQPAAAGAAPASPFRGAGLELLLRPVDHASLTVW
jgi:ribosomal protein S18 acetylase RimI-like enzyme